MGSNQIHLTAEQQHYLYRVLRLKVGDGFLALDGQGHQWMAELTADPTRAIATPLPAAPAPQPAITLAIALPKGSGFDEVVRQTTELGVTTLQPVITSRTLPHSNNKKLPRWQRIAAEATEQSERLWMPTVLPPIPWKEYLDQGGSGQRWLCVARQSVPHLLTRLEACDRTTEITIATGPEGGWTEAEILAATAAGFQPVSLGPQILRAVTAPLAALAIVTAVFHRQS